MLYHGTVGVPRRAAAGDHWLVGPGHSPRVVQGVTPGLPRGDQPITREGAEHAHSNVNDLHSAGPALDGLAAGDYEGCAGGGPHRGAHGRDAGGGGAGAAGGGTGGPTARVAGTAAARARPGVRRTTVAAAGRGPTAGVLCC